MKHKTIVALSMCLLLLILVNSTNAQDQSSKRSKKAIVSEAAGSAAKEVGKATVKIAAVTVKAAAEHVIVPTAKVIWDPFLTKAAPKVLSETAKLAGKGIKNGFKLIFKRDKAKPPLDPGT